MTHSLYLGLERGFVHRAQLALAFLSHLPWLATNIVQGAPRQQ